MDYSRPELSQSSLLNPLPKPFQDLQKLAQSGKRLAETCSTPIVNDAEIGTLEDAICSSIGDAFVRFSERVGQRYGYDKVIVDKELKEGLEEFGVANDMLIMFYPYTPKELMARLPSAWENYCVLWVTKDGKVAQYQVEDGVFLTDLVWADGEEVFEKILKATGWGTLQHPKFPPAQDIVCMEILGCLDDEYPPYVEYFKKKAAERGGDR
ncbi:hypothetical protein BJ508DRAFT_328540 [Ascobolus immersus RN42]|uniref:Uncharacterized protein n=1 Tax=Ascobolus immersus RN42 TaxID=1160509 RepID=A0A3N4I391_ASCIM|nr:hypothetical protein BJ508DRAFT_328540 [Ascobolus immersus RN42]